MLCGAEPADWAFLGPGRPWHARAAGSGPSVPWCRCHPVGDPGPSVPVSDLWRHHHGRAAWRGPVPPLWGRGDRDHRAWLGARAPVPGRRAPGRRRSRCGRPGVAGGTPLGGCHPGGPPIRWPGAPVPTRIFASTHRGAGSNDAARAGAPRSGLARSPRAGVRGRWAGCVMVFRGHGQGARSPPRWIDEVGEPT